MELAAIDQRILDVIDEVRAAKGACSTGQLAARMGISRDVLRVRCHLLRELGFVEYSEVPGSLRRRVDTRDRLFTELIAAAVRAKAGVSDGSGGEPADEWCAQLIKDTTATVWPDPGPVRAPEPEVETTAAEAQESTSTENRCEPCDRTFKGVGQLLGHEKSRAHLARIAQLIQPS